ncbi:RNA-binding protein 48-like, partial [Scleropages formosus]
MKRKMATSGSGGSCWSTPEVHKHHEQKIVCHTRPKYREGRRLRAVKVYTINLESRFLLVQGVPALGAMKELVELMALYGPVEEYRVLDEYPAEQFTEVYLFKFRTLRMKALDEPEEKIERNAAEDSTCEIPKPENERGSWDFRERETWNEKGSWDLSYPLLPLPPQEGFPSVFEQMVYEDSMGSTYSAGTSDQPIASVGQKCSSDRSTVVYIKVKDRPPPAKLIPRTAHLQNRKRKMEEASKAFLLGTTEKNDTLIGPKLPELPKVDMEDDSLNITVNLIRSTMAK